MKGKRAREIFLNESGSHRFQRVPPTEKRGRVHTSTVTVAVIERVRQKQRCIRPEDLRWDFYKSPGKGGQNKNRRLTAVRITHRPTGVVVHATKHRTQGKNKDEAFRALQLKLKEGVENEAAYSENKVRRGQVGAGRRGEKSRTYIEKKDLVINHKNNKHLSLKRFQKGYIEKLH